MYPTKYKKKTLKASPPVSSEPEANSLTGHRRKSRPVRDVHPIANEESIPKSQVAKHALENIESVQAINEVDAKIQGELTPQEIRDLRYVFDTFDNEHRGFIDSNDLRRAMRAMGFKLNPNDMNEMTGDIQGGHGTTIEVRFQQFLELVVYKQGDARDMYAELEQGFKMMDIGEKGHLNFDDIKRLPRWRE